MNKKIESEIAIGIIVIVAILVGGAFWMRAEKAQAPAVQPVAMQQPTAPAAQTQPAVQQPTTQPTQTDDTANWQTYTNAKFGFSFKYPAAGYEFHVGNLKVDEPQFFVKNSNDSDKGYYALSITALNSSTVAFQNSLQESKSFDQEYSKTTLAGVEAYLRVYEGGGVTIYELLHNGIEYTFVYKNNDIGAKILSTLKFTK